MWACGNQSTENALLFELDIMANTRLQFHTTTDFLSGKGFGDLDGVVGATMIKEVMFIAPDTHGILDVGTKLIGALNHPLKTSKTGDVARQIYTATAEALEPKDDSFASKEFITLEGVRVILSILPKACSRHNSQSRGWAVTEAVQAAGLSATRSAIFLLPGNDAHAYAQAVAAGKCFSPYSHKSSDTKDSKTVDVVIDLSGASDASTRIISEVTHTVEGLRLCQKLVDTPPNELHTDAYVEVCREVAREIGSEVTVIQGFTHTHTHTHYFRFNEKQPAFLSLFKACRLTELTLATGEELERRGFGGLWGVGKASEHLPALVVLSHSPKEATPEQESVCLVGKGIVYDTGGLSIKTPTTYMCGMKTDMGGSAGVLGAFYALVKTGCAVPLHAVLCVAENSVGPLATRPDDIHTLLSGKTVEINNTDAEGRLVLADGCFYAESQLNAGYILDMATLTGAQGVATGKRFAALYCNDDDLEVLTLRVIVDF